MTMIKLQMAHHITMNPVKIRYSEDPLSNETDYSVISMLQELRACQNPIVPGYKDLKALSPQETLNRARVIRGYTVIPGPKPTESKEAQGPKQIDVSQISDPAIKIQILELQIANLKLQQQVDKLKGKKHSRNVQSERVIPIPQEQKSTVSFARNFLGESSSKQESQRLFTHENDDEEADDHYSSPSQEYDNESIESPFSEENDHDQFYQERGYHTDAIYDSYDEYEEIDIENHSQPFTELNYDKHPYQSDYDMINDDSVNAIQSNRHYVNITVHAQGYPDYEVPGLHDTGCTLLLAKDHIFPPELWIDTPAKRLYFANQEFTITDKKVHNQTFTIGNKQYAFDFYQFNDMKYDVIIGNNFWSHLSQIGPQLFHNNTLIAADGNIIKFYDNYQSGPLSPWAKTATVSGVLHAERGEPITEKRQLLLEYSNNEFGKAQIQSSEPQKLCIMESPNKQAQDLDGKTGPGQSPFDLKLLRVKEILHESFGVHPQQFYKEGQPKCVLFLKNTRMEPIRVKPIPLTPVDSKEMERQINELLNSGLIRVTSSPWSSPAFLVRNHSEIKRGKARMVINYAPLNAHLVKDAYRLPNMFGLIQKLRYSKWYTKLDCTSGYWQVRMDEASIPLTAFSTPVGSYEWLVMPFGLLTAPAIFQRKMDAIFNEHSEYCSAYIDDIIIFSNSRAEHLVHLEKIALTIKEAGLVLSEKKAEICKSKIQFLGCEIEGGKISLQPHVLVKLANYPEVLKSKKELSSFLGIVNFAAKDSVQNIAAIKRPLQEKLKKNVVFTWNQEDIQIVRHIKEICKSLPVLELPLEGDQLFVYTDASDTAWGGILKFKKVRDGQIDPQFTLARYCSGAWNQSEQNWTAFDKELRAVKNVLKSFKLMLYQPFTLQIDSSAVVSYLNKTGIDPMRSAKQVRDKLSILFFKEWMRILHVPGKNNFIADALTRNLLAKGSQDVSSKE
ncbi:polymerase [Viola yellow mottle virus]|uniref:RNA-directed DNA polymerase n=1 Tax=Viola yellow mottle virus TaxID=2922803 RepID=A0A976MFW4_9VIRU|nr:polymerase [Viola yellow mottle virus]